MKTKVLHLSPFRIVLNSYFVPMTLGISGAQALSLLCPAGKPNLRHSNLLIIKIYLLTVGSVGTGTDTHGNRMTASP